MHTATTTRPETCWEFCTALSALSLPRLADEVFKDDVQKALRLLKMSKDSLNQTDQKTTYPQNKIFALVRELAGASKTAKILDAMERSAIIFLLLIL
ncbi:hypothetical protein quinque_002280 [Culex quinquefasciatus]